MLLVKFTILTFPFGQISFASFLWLKSVKELSIETENARYEFHVWWVYAFTKSEFSNKISCFEVKNLAAFSIFFNSCKQLMVKCHWYRFDLVLKSFKLIDQLKAFIFIVLLNDLIRWDSSFIIPSVKHLIVICIMGNSLILTHLPVQNFYIQSS